MFLFVVCRELLLLCPPAIGAHGHQPLIILHCGRSENNIWYCSIIFRCHRSFNVSVGLDEASCTGLVALPKLCGDSYFFVSYLPGPVWCKPNLSFVAC